MAALTLTDKEKAVLADLDPRLAQIFESGAVDSGNTSLLSALSGYAQAANVDGVDYRAVIRQSFEAGVIAALRALVLLPEDWHEVGAAGEPAFQNSWVNYDASLYATAAFYKDPFGRVHLKGLVKSGVIGVFTPIFTLPAGYRPSKELEFAGSSNAAFADLRILTDGSVSVSSGSNVWVALNGLSFRV